MKPRFFLCFAAVLLFTFAVSGCLSVPSSPVPKFYTLHTNLIAGQNKQLDIPSKLIIGIGPIEIPEYQNRPQIVTQDKDGMLTFAQFERWGESLDLGIGRLILDSLVLTFPQAEFQSFPCNFSIPLDYQVMVNILRLESQLDKDLFLAAQWTILDSKNKQMLLTKRSEFRQPIQPHNYSGLAQALSQVVTMLSQEIADNLSGLALKTETKVVPGQ